MKALIYLVFALLLLLRSSVSQTLVGYLPGYPGPLPFKLETGYIGVGENEVVHLFYYFVESQTNPDEDPLIIWLDGGPDRSFFHEIGPLQFQYGEYIEDVPALTLNPYSWTEVSNVIYLDIGYSYAGTPNVDSSDTSFASQIVEFLRKFVTNHSKFSKNPIYIAGVSYSGIIIPIVTEELYKGNDMGLQPNLNINGYILGNPLTDIWDNINSRLDYAFRMGLISIGLFESTRTNCNNGNADSDPENLLCMEDITEVNKRLQDINLLHILEPNCQSVKTEIIESGNPMLHENKERKLRAHASHDYVICQDNSRKHASVWARDKNVKRSLNVREVIEEQLGICSPNMYHNCGESSMPAYDFNVKSSVIYHTHLTNRNCRALIFSGDHDLMVPHIGTLNWIRSLNLKIIDSNWDPWLVDGGKAGFKTTFARGNYTLVFTTIKGAGHIALEHKPKECFEMIKKWFAHNPI